MEALDCIGHRSTPVNEASGPPQNCCSVAGLATQVVWNRARLDTAHATIACLPVRISKVAHLQVSSGSITSQATASRAFEGT